jgi:peptidoglycan/xylan/chitin deacetylase (PgdA/CDA1 family)
MHVSNCENKAQNEWLGEKPSRLHDAALWAATRTAAMLQNVSGNRCQEGFAILMYHRVAENPSGVARPTFNVTPQQLRRQLAGLLDRGFECWSLNRLIAAHNAKRPMPSNVFAVTFDDGYENNYTGAWPVLRELNVPATIFLATKYLDTDQPFPFDDWPAKGSSRVPPSSWRPLSTQQCEEILAEGLIEFGAHTHRHERFVGRVDEFCRDMELCLGVLLDRFGIECPSFTFPYGDMSPELVDSAERLGVTCSLSTRPERVLPECSPYEWGRFWVDSGDSPTALAAKLSGWYSAVHSVGKRLSSPLAKVARIRRPHPLPLVASHQVPCVEALSADR